VLSIVLLIEESVGLNGLTQSLGQGPPLLSRNLCDHNVLIGSFGKVIIANILMMAVKDLAPALKHTKEYNMLMSMLLLSPNRP